MTTEMNQQPPPGYAPQYGAQPQYGAPAPQYGGQQMQPQYTNYAQPQQQMPQGTTVIVVQQTGFVTKCPEAEQILTSGFCNCCDDAETCLCAFFCQGCAFGTYVERAGLGSCCSACCLYWCLCTYARACLACYAGNMRSALYQKLGLPDPGCCLSCLCHTCCACCALAQEGRAAKKMWEQRGGGKPMQANVVRM